MGDINHKICIGILFIQPEGVAAAPVPHDVPQGPALQHRCGPPVNDIAIVVIMYKMHISYIIITVIFIVFFCIVVLSLLSVLDEYYRYRSHWCCCVVVVLLFLLLLLISSSRMPRSTSSASPHMSVQSAGYLGSMGATLYAALGMHSYIFSLICCAAQVRLPMFPLSAGMSALLNAGKGLC